MFRRKTARPPPPLVGSAAAASANALTARWARTHEDGDVALSGLGCWVLLALLASGAGGKARSELASAVGLPAARGIEAGGELLATLRDAPAVRAALGLWSKVVVDQAWYAGLPAGVIGELTGDPESDQSRLDRWVAEATGGLLTTMPVTLSADTVLLLASDLTVQTDWVEPFEEHAGPGQGPWAQQPLSWCVGSTFELDRLRIVETEVGKVTLLRVPGQRDIDVHLMRTASTVAPGAALAAGITGLGARPECTGGGLTKKSSAPGVQVERLVCEEPSDHLILRVPAFIVESSHDLLRHSDVFGLDTASDSTRGHFPGISAEPLAVEQARQNVTAEFTTTGFRAAVVSSMGMLVGAAPPTHRANVKRIRVSFDEPFGFAAIHRPSSLILVAGWVATPGSRAIATHGGP